MPAEGKPPRLAVIVASAASGAFLGRCLTSLESQARATGSEILVVDRVGDSWRDQIRAAHPSVRVLGHSGPGRPSVPELRAFGVDHVSAPLVAVLEEHCVAPDDWLHTILASFDAADAIGGPILDDDFQRLRDWVVYFAEYSADLPPWPAGERHWLNDANAAYRREHLVAHRDDLGASYWAITLHPRLLASGLKLRAVPAMGVRHTGPFDYAYYLRQRYLLSRLWGGSQRHRCSTAVRLAHLAAGPIFPLFLLLRIGRRVRATGSARLQGRFWATLPLLLPVTVAYTVGEWLGYLVGPGNAAEEVE